MSIKSIFIKATIDGDGIVNFDSDEQKRNWNSLKDVEYIRTNNVSLGKAVYTFKDDTLIRIPKISADCLRHAMWEDEMPNKMPNIMLDMDLLVNVLASQSALERGYLFTKEGGGTFVRKSSVRFSSAKASSMSPPVLEFHSSSSPKQKNLDNEKSSDSIFQKESRGDIEYSLEGVIDIQDLQFISLSDLHGRMAVHPDLVDKYRDLLGKRLGSEIPKPNYYVKKNDVYKSIEFGILLTQGQVGYLVGDILKRLSTVNIQRTTTGYARASTVEIKMVSDPIYDLFSEQDGWISIKQNGQRPNIPNDLHNKEFAEFYELDPEGEERLVSFKNKMQEEKEKSKKKNEEKKQEQAAKRVNKKAKTSK